MLSVYRIFCSFLLLVITVCPECSASTIEMEFFRGEIPTRLERLENYSLEDQWRIFLYGNQVVHPPVKGLALPVARQGRIALEYILE